MATTLERKALFYFYKKYKPKVSGRCDQSHSRAVDAVQGACITDTTDNSREFANHEEIANTLATKVYFAHPYRSCE